MKYYLLLGSDACRTFFDTDDIQTVKDKHDGEYDTFCFTEGDRPHELLAAFAGWGDYSFLTEEQYNLLND